MIIDEITEDNYLEKREEGKKVVDEKLKKIGEQREEIEFNKQKAKRLGVYPKYESIDWKIFLDPTIWAYNFLKDKKGNPLRLRGFQDMIINDKHQEVVVVASNQIGKTLAMAEVKALHHAIHVNNARVLIISKSQDQSIMILDEIKQLMINAQLPFETIIGDVENRMELHIKNTDKKGISIIRCLPPTTSVLGFYATLVICDEIGFWEIENMRQLEYYNRVIYSRTLDTQNWKVIQNGIDMNKFFTFGQIVCISNPNAQQGALWSLFNSPRTHKYRYCFLANPENTLEKYNQMKTDPDISSDEFDSVYAATFSSASGGFITQSEYNDAVRDYSVFPPPNEMFCLGGDFAGEDTVTRDVDSTVLIGGQKIKEEDKEKVKIVYYSNFPLRVKKQEVYDEIIRLHDISNFSYDKAGVGDSIKNDLIDQKIFSEYQIESLTYSLPNKSEVYYNMKRLFEQRRMIIPDLPKLKEQLLGLRFERTNAGHLNKPVIMVHHEREGLHDDYADALANCCWATMRSSAIPVDLTIVRREPEKIEQTNKGTLTFCDKCDNYFYSNKEHECPTTI